MNKILTYSQPTCTDRLAWRYGLGVLAGVRVVVRVRFSPKKAVVLVDVFQESADSQKKT